ncbi:hypothetical protein HY950_01500 [Candidatus Gottesmanbacteria bacterium]|nr:hypothetical protein [Candidatus Gottesmanbacteria bacterium]
MKGNDWKWLGVGAAVLVGLLGLAFYRGLFRYVLFDPAWNYKGMVVAPGDCSAGNPEIVGLTNSCMMMYTRGQTKDAHFLGRIHYGVALCIGGYPQKNKTEVIGYYLKKRYENKG